MATITKKQINEKSDAQLIHAHFFFVDIVGLSDPELSTKNQIRKLQILKNCIAKTIVFKSTPKSNLLVDQHGDGMCIGFLQGPELPLELAIEVQKKLSSYNKGKIAADMVNVRIGLNSGICYVVKDLSGSKTTWGPGIILAKRVMDFGGDGHILLTPELAEDLREISDHYKKIIKPVHDFEIKHGQNILVYSAYGELFGNKQHPIRGDAQTTKFWEEITKAQRTSLYPMVEVQLTIIDPKTMLVQHKRTYEIKNIVNEPIKDVLHGIATDVEKYSLDDLNVKVFDENQKGMKISSINVDKPTTKEFTTRFNEPVKHGQIGRKFTLMYEVEEPERYFENAFQIDVGKFVLKLKYPDTAKFTPKIFQINQETDEKFIIKNQPKIEKDGKYNIVTFSKNENNKGEALRIEW